MNKLLALLDSTTRELLAYRCKVIGEFSGEIRQDKINALDEINAVREEAGLSLLTREVIADWDGEFDDD